MKYEYTTKEYSRQYDINTNEFIGEPVEKLLNDAGEDGWLLTFIETHPDGRKTLYFMKGHEQII